jgi:hypothetical protein
MRGLLLNFNGLRNKPDSHSRAVESICEDLESGCEQSAPTDSKESAIRRLAQHFRSQGAVQAYL